MGCSAPFTDYKVWSEEYGNLEHEWNGVIYDGYPRKAFMGDANATDAEKIEGANERMAWCIEKAKACPYPNGKLEYITFANLSLSRLYYNELIDDSNAKVNGYRKEMVEIYDHIDESAFKASGQEKKAGEAYYWTRKRSDAEKKAYKEEQAKAKAERDAKIAANSKPMPASKMGDAALLSSCLKAIQQQFPKEEAKAVSIINPTWMIDRDVYGNILRRRVSAWVNIKDPDSGRRIARSYGFAQEYMGGGKYGSTIFYGVGTEAPFYLK